MKKLIALFAVSTLASTSAIAGIALSGTASVSYDDNGSLASSTTHDADLTITGTSGGTTLTASYDMEGASLATTIFLSEKKVIPEEYKEEVYKASGFMEPRVIDDYPIRDMLVCLSIKRRRWDVTINNQVVKINRDYPWYR